LPFEVVGRCRNHLATPLSSSPWWSSVSSAVGVSPRIIILAIYFRQIALRWITKFVCGLLKFQEANKDAINSTGLQRPEHSRNEYFWFPFSDPYTLCRTKRHVPKESGSSVRQMCPERKLLVLSVGRSSTRLSPFDLLIRTLSFQTFSCHRICNRLRWRLILKTTSFVVHTVSMLQ